MGRLWRETQREKNPNNIRNENYKRKVKIYEQLYINLD